MKSSIEANHATVFVSHNKADKDKAREVAIFLTAEGINVWFDEWKISAGDSIVQEINEGLYGCTHFIVLWSKNASKSNWVRRELQSTLAHAINTDSPRVIPILLDESPLPPLLSDILYIRYHDGNEEDRQEIVRSITGHLPSENFIRSIVKKYHEVIRNPNAKDPFGLIACPGCGNFDLTYDMTIMSDEEFYLAMCEECGWNEVTQ